MYKAKQTTLWPYISELALLRLQHYVVLILVLANGLQKGYSEERPDQGRAPREEAQRAIYARQSNAVGDLLDCARKAE